MSLSDGSKQAIFNMLDQNGRTTDLQNQAHDNMEQQGFQEVNPPENVAEINSAELVRRSTSFFQNNEPHGCFYAEVNNVFDTFSPVVEDKISATLLNAGTIKGRTVVNGAKRKYNSHLHTPLEPPKKIKTERYVNYTPLCKSPPTEVFMVKNITELNWSKLLNIRPVCIIRGLEVAGGMYLQNRVMMNVTANGKDKCRIREQLHEDNEENPWLVNNVRCKLSTVEEFNAFMGIEFTNDLKEIVGETTFLENENVMFESTEESVNSSYHSRKSYFADNIDLTTKTWNELLKDFQKLPNALRHDTTENKLCLLENSFRDINKVKLCMAAPNVKFGARQDVCTSVYFNAGSAYIEWNVVPFDNSNALQAMCDDNNVDFHSDSCLPNVTELRNARIPVHTFLQKPGDLVYLSPGSVYWFKSLEGVFLVSWNIFPILHHQLSVALHMNQMAKIHGVNDPFPLEHLLWLIAKNTVIRDNEVFKLLKKALISSLTAMTYEQKFAEEFDYFLRCQPQPNLPTEREYCQRCERLFFGGYFVDKEHQPLCVRCLLGAEYWYIPFTDSDTLVSIFDNFRLAR